jgi:hypothetical protein
LRSSRPSRETSGPASRKNKIVLSICAGIRTTFKLLTLFFSFPSFYERQTPFPSPFSPVRPKPLMRLDAKPQRPKDARQLQMTNFQWPISNVRSRQSFSSSVASVRSRSRFLVPSPSAPREASLPLGDSLAPQNPQKCQ